MQRYFCAVLLALTGLVSAQEAKPVTLNCPGARLGEAIRQLADASQTKLLANPTIADSEIVAFRFKDAPLDEAMKRIATAVSGRWEKSGTTWILSPDAQLRNLQLANRRKRRLAQLQKQIRDELTPTKQPAEGGEVEQGMMMGGDLVVTKVVSTLDLGSFVDLPEDGRVVYSTIPNPTQRSMRLAPQVIQELVSAHNKEAAEQGTDETTDPEAQKLREYMERFGMGRRKVAIKEEPYKAILVVERGGTLGGGDSIQATLRLYSNQGSVLLSRTGSYYLASVPTAPVEVPTPEEAPPEKSKPEPQSPKIEWSDLAKELQARLSQGPFEGGAAPAKPWSKLAREALSSPDRTEPLQYLLGDGLLQVAAWKNVNMVASLSDQIAESMSGGTLATTCSALLTWAETTESLESKIDSAWWTIAPSDPVASRESRFDRVSLTPLAKKAMAGDSLTMSDLAAYALKSPPPMSTPLGAMLLFTLEPSIIRLAIMPDAWDYLRLWGTLSPQQRVTGRMAFGGLSPNQTGIVTRIIFGASPELQVGADPADMEALGSFGSMMMTGFGAAGAREDSDYREEPTELLPNGLPSAGSLVIQVKEDIALKTAASGGEMDWMAMFGTLGVEDLALYRFMGDKVGAATQQGIPRVDRVTVGKRTNITIELHVADGVKSKRQFADDSFEKDAKPISVESLSPEIKARIDKAMEQIKKMNLPFFDPGMFGRPPGPPPTR